MENNYRIIKTEDGSLSLYSNEYEQAMHSTSGAYQEALLKHVLPSRILDSLHDELFVLDIGFGIGYNILALITEFLRKKLNQTLNIISLEKDNSYKSLINDFIFNDERDVIYTKIKETLSTGSIDKGNYSIQIKYGDARKSIKDMSNYSFDAVFHDPYGPSKNPELWSVEFFSELKKVMKEHSILTTYSSASQIRMALVEAGFTIWKGPPVGKKREGTIASRNNIISGSGEIDIMSLKSDKNSVPYRDYNLMDTREEIITRRIKMKKEIRIKGL